jgi:hypothetical protein
LTVAFIVGAARVPAMESPRSTQPSSTVARCVSARTSWRSTLSASIRMSTVPLSGTVPRKAMRPPLSLTSVV